VRTPAEGRGTVRQMRWAEEMQRSAPSIADWERTCCEMQLLNRVIHEGEKYQ
jgi:hypothetical protein